MALKARQIPVRRGVSFIKMLSAQARGPAAAAILGALAASAGCTIILGDFGPATDATGSAASSNTSTGTGGSTGQGGGGGASGTGGAGGGGSAVPCPSGKGSEMVVIPGMDEVPSYCIDATEVTVAHYFQWLATKPDPMDQPDVCKPWNMNHEPKKAANACGMITFDPAMTPNRPIGCVTWCDAAQFCKWAGKRLCGAVGGGPNEADDPSNPTKSQWYRACSQGGTRKYPYGEAYDALKCVGDGYDGMPGYQIPTDRTIDVKAASGCEGAYPGLFDMSGNVREWEDTCDTQMGENDTCYSRSGSCEEPDTDLECNDTDNHQRKTALNEVGIRCCADLSP